MGTATMLNAGRNYLIPENTRGRPCGLGQTAPMSLGGERIALCYEILFHVLGVTGIDYRDGVTVDGTYSWHRIDLVNHSVKPLAHSFQVNSMICRD